jgi:hypothetical protein
MDLLIWYKDIIRPVVWVESFTRQNTEFTPSDMNFEEEDSDDSELEFSEEEEDEEEEEEPIPQIVENNDYFLLNTFGTPLCIGAAFIEASEHTFVRFGLGIWRKVMETSLKESGVSIADRNEMCDGMFHDTATRDRYYIVRDESARSANQARLYNRYRQSKNVYYFKI